MLTNLPTEIKRMVNYGLYTLYEVANNDNVSYVLLSSNSRNPAYKFYALSNEGSILPHKVNLKSLELVKTISFPEVRN